MYLISYQEKPEFHITYHIYQKKPSLTLNSLGTVIATPLYITIEVHQYTTNSIPLKQYNVVTREAIFNKRVNSNYYYKMQTLT